MQITNETWEETGMALAKSNPVLAKLFLENAKVGSENLSSGLPLLKVNSAGKSQKNELKDGSQPKDGFFYYKPSKEQFETIDCHILTVSKGFRADGYGDKKDVFNQIVAGVIMNEGYNVMPFIMYFTGIKLQNLWDFGKEASEYTKSKQFPIPLFALKVKLTSEQLKHNHGTGWVVKFNIQRDENGFPIVIQDEKLFMALKKDVAKIEHEILGLIEQKISEDVFPSAPIPNNDF